MYFRRFYRLPNLVKPESFNEKLNWRKLHDFDPLLTIAADKIESKKFVELVCPEIEIPKTLWVSDRFDDLPIDSLPSKYVLKANHGSRMNLFIDDSNRLQIEQLKALLPRWMNHDQFITLGERAYKNIVKRVFAEEFLEFAGTVPDDYKFFVYHGEVKFIQLDTGRFGQHHRNMYNVNWDDLNINFSHQQKLPSPEKPLLFSKMKAAAEKLGQYFTFIRVDFYQHNNKVYFGELTVYPGAGYEVFPSSDIDKMFGEPWDISRKPQKQYQI
nr:ATP-grasp fold amidoligase family protein [Psychrosphaera haliotis]